MLDKIIDYWYLNDDTASGKLMVQNLLMLLENELTDILNEDIIINSDMEFMDKR